MRTFLHSIRGRCLALLLASSIATLGCEVARSQSPSRGAPQFQDPNFIAVPGGAVNAAGGNLLLERVDLSIDTLLGTSEIRATYNSSSEEWLWNFQISFDGATFVDPTGAVHDGSSVADGAPIPGTVWVKVDSDTIQTKGGLAFDFDAGGKLAASHWATLAHPRIQYTWTDELLEIAQCTAALVCMPFFWIELGAGASPTSITDLRTSRLAEFEYDWRGRLVAARDALDMEKGWPGYRYEYGSFGGLLTSVTNSEGERIEYRYVERGKIRDVIQIGGGNPTHFFRYFAKNASGLYQTVHTNPLGGATRYLFDAERRLHSLELDDTGETRSISWSAAAARRPSGETRAGGVTTTYTYEGDDLVGIVLPSGNAASILYEPEGLDTANPFLRAVRRIEDGVGLVEERTYDALGRPETSANGEGETTTTTYGPATVSSITGPFGAARWFPHYGVHGHWLTMEGPATDKRSFDPVGNVLVPATPMRGGGVLARSYDADRNLVSLDVASTAGGRVESESVVSVERRSDGSMRSVRRPGNADHELAYDALGRVVLQRERVDGQWQATALEYDPGGNVTARSLPNGMREEFEYDRYGRLERRRALRDGVFEEEAIFTYRDGNLVSVYDTIRDASESYGYDTAGRRHFTHFSHGESLRFEYDLRSRVEREIFSLPEVGIIRTIAYEYDLANRQVSISTGTDEVLVERSYQDGLLVETRTGNGLIRNRGYDPETGDLRETTTIDALGEVVETTVVARTVETAPVRHQVKAETATPLGSTEEQYWLAVGGSLQDPDKLVGKRVFAWNDGNGRSKSYAYDALSNQMSNGDGDLFTYNGEGNRLSSAALAGEGISVDYAYDAAGYATSRDGVPITWTATGRMSSYGPIELEWDMQGRLVSLTAGGVTRDFSLYGGRVESDPETGSLGALDLGEVSLPFGSTERLYRHLDFRGNVSFVSNESGEIVNHYRYHPYGVDAVLGSGGNEVTFVGRNELGPFMLLGARMYDPVVGRFISPDPVFSLLNQYSYTLGNPVWFSDPDGRQSGGNLGGLSGDQVRTILEGVTALLAITLRFVPAASPQVAVALGVLVLILLIAEALSNSASMHVPLSNPAGGFSGSLAVQPAFSSSAAGVAASAGAVGATCAPVSLYSVGETRWIPGLLLLLQVLLGTIILRRRRPQPGGIRC